jgi:DNA gyrase/topoisomerase IV subunit B
MPPKVSQAVRKSPQKQKYVKKDPISHILDRPDMYVGSTRARDIEDFVVVDESYRIQRKTIKVSPAILRIFIEPLSNVIDNVARSRQGKNKVTKIAIEIDEETGKISLWNDGDVIPVEMHEEEKCYNHTMIFGHLLTSSNYDDDEDREDISGRNGYGIKLCLKRGTQVPKFSGEISNIEDVNIGDHLIGDDGMPRKVVGKTEGFGKLYKISQLRGNPYIVNENHILTVCMPDHKVIFWNAIKNGWSVLWLDATKKKIHTKNIKVGYKAVYQCELCGKHFSGNLRRHYGRMHPAINIPKKKRSSPTVNAPDTDEVKLAREKMEEFVSNIPDNNTMDISIQEYMNLNKTTQGRLSGFFGNCVQWKERSVKLDPYVLGLWLGDGFQNGYRFAINSEKDPEILDYLTRWGAKNDATFKQVLNQPVQFSISSSSKSRIAPLKKLLDHYDLLNNKHIPQEYIVNSRRVRLAVLAGIIDSDGCVNIEGRRITIAQGMEHSKLAEDIIFLAKSLGFMCSSRIKKTQWDYHGEIRRGTAININISGNGVEDIPTLLKRKRCFPPLKREVTNTGKLQIDEVEDGDFIGLEVDSNHRFVLEDFTVTHNCNIFSKEFIVEGVDPSNKKQLKQVWKNNMRDTKDPVITPSKGKGYTKISFTPDFKQFGLEGFTKDILSIYRRFVVDAAMITKVPVFLNDEEIPVNSLADYAKLYGNDEKESLTIKTKDCEVVVTPSNNEFQSISFANGVCTPLGGTHVDSWTEAIFRPLVDKLNKPKKPQVNIGEIKKYFRLFVVATVKKPEFDSQSKTKLEAPQIEAEVKKTHIAVIAKWSVMEMLEDFIRAKEMVVLKKAERKKRGYEKVEGLDPANNEGSAKGHECTLILVEGLSAKTYAAWGIQKGAFGKKGRDWFGIYALRGKCIAPDTPVLLWDGRVEQADKIVVGDILIGGNGRPCTVKKLFSGQDDMFRISQTYGDSYTVNSQHTLSLKVVEHKKIIWRHKTNSWRVGYFDKEKLQMRFVEIKCKSKDALLPNKSDALREIEKYVDEKTDTSIQKIGEKYNVPKSTLQMHYSHYKNKKKCNCGIGSGGNQGSSLSKEEGYQKCMDLIKNIDNENIFNIDIQDYLSLSNTTKGYLKGYKAGVNWDTQKVNIDPYILGLWLGDGLSNGYGFSGEDSEIVAEWVKWGRQNNCEIVHNNRDSFVIRQKGYGKCPAIGTNISSCSECRACQSKENTMCANNSELSEKGCDRQICVEKMGLNPFKNLLEQYNLVNNKHIPDCYLQNDRQTRLKLLAGIIDTDGYVEKNRIEIVQSIVHKKLFDQIVYLCQSLGFSAKVYNKNTTWNVGTEKRYGKAYRLYISGPGIEEIPTVLPRKKCTSSIRENINSSIKVENTGIGPYVGFEVDNEHTFLLGDFTVTHNCLNCRNSKPLTISKNAVVTDIIKALGIQYGVDYSDDDNYLKLRYGRVMIVTDADVDGLHISGLLQNMFHALFPTLLRRDPPFITSMQTPIVRVFQGKTDKLFYDEQEYRRYVKENQGKKINKKYYKGLGSSNEEDVMETFGQKLVEFEEDNHTFESMNKAFHTKYSDMRKDWLEHYDPANSVLNWNGNNAEKKTITYTQYIDTELIKFSLDDCKRSIPSLMDGLKEGHRKVLYVTFLRKFKYTGKTIKVAQLAGSVSEKACYHHGEKNLESTMTGMANSYVGSNNIPLLFRDGQFGSRAEGGKDAAAGRYIFTKLDAMTRLLFREEDDVLLEQNEDDGDKVEPKFYVPIIPMILVNGSLGIGTGWSSSVPCYNPEDLVVAIKAWLENGNQAFDTKDGVTISLLPELKPWYRGHTGNMVSEGDGKFTSWGRVEKDDKGKSHVTELPIGMWTSGFVESLEKLREEKQIASYKNHSTPKDINFIITETDDGITCDENNLKLHTPIRTSNMVLFTEEGGLKKFTSPEEIIDNFCRIRYNFYVKRKVKQLKDIEREIKILGNKKRFLQEVRDGDIKLFDEVKGKKQSRKTADIVEELEEMGYDKDVDEKEEDDKEEDEEEKEEKKGGKSSHGYEYLLRLQISSITAEKIVKLENDIANRESEHEELLETSEKELWVRDLDEFSTAYTKWLPIINSEKHKKGKKKE